jgi:hypothetical protein
MPERLEKESTTCLIGERVLGILQLLEILSHVIGGPRGVTGDILNVVEIVPAGKETDESVVFRAATKTAIARIKVTKHC